MLELYQAEGCRYSAKVGHSWQNIGVLLASTLVIGTNARVLAVVG
jgi:hypothetical protein